MSEALNSREIYLDYQASTPCDPAVVEAMLPFLVHDSANPSSPHRAGRRARAAVGRARGEVAAALGCEPSEIVFTSGATESNNLAILGGAAAPGGRSGFVTTAIEHKSVLAPLKLLSQREFKVTACPVRPDGQLELGALSELLDSQVRLVSVQLASNEIGTIQPVLEIGQLAHRSGALFHVDAAQAFGKMPIDVDELDVDLMSISAHKCYGPKGVGALFVRGGASSGLVSAILGGGDQEAGLRPGTPNVPAIVGFGRSAVLAMERLESESRQSAEKRDRLERIVCEMVEGVTVNGAVGRRLCNATSLTFRHVDAEALIANLPELALSSSSACNSGAPEPSHVLLGIGLDRKTAYRTIRCSVGRFTTRSDVEYSGRRIAEVVNKLAKVSP